MLDPGVFSPLSVSWKWRQTDLKHPRNQIESGLNHLTGGGGGGGGAFSRKYEFKREVSFTRLERVFTLLMNLWLIVSVGEYDYAGEC